MPLLRVVRRQEVQPARVVAERGGQVLVSEPIVTLFFLLACGRALMREARDRSIAMAPLTAAFDALFVLYDAARAALFPRRGASSSLEAE